MGDELVWQCAEIERKKEREKYSIFFLLISHYTLTIIVGDQRKVVSLLRVDGTADVTFERQAPYSSRSDDHCPYSHRGRSLCYDDVRRNREYC